MHGHLNVKRMVCSLQSVDNESLIGWLAGWLVGGSLASLID